MKKYVYNVKGLLIIQVVFATLSGLLQVLFPYLTLLLFDYDFSQGFEGILLIVGAYGVTIAVSVVSGYFCQVFSWKLGRAFKISIRKDLFAVMSKISPIAFQSRSTGEYMSIISNDVSVIEEEFLESLTNLINSIISIMLYATMLFVFIDYRIASVILLVSLITVFIPMITGKRLAELRKAHLSALGRYTSLLQNLLNSHNLFNRKSVHTVGDKHRDLLVEVENKHLKSGVFKAFKNIINYLAMNILSISAFAAAAYLLYAGEITIGVGVATLGYIESFIDPIKYIVNDVNSINGTKEARQEMNEFLNQPMPNYPTAEHFNHDIQFSGVCISYENFTVKDFSFVFEKGKKYAIIGHSGSGKTSIVKAFLKQVEISSGQIRINGQDIAQIDISSIVSWVSQDEHLFEAGLTDNITMFGAYELTDTKRLEEIASFEIWDTLSTAENCQDLSGGEKQIVGLLRSLNMNTPVLVLDEPFSAVDVKTAKRINDYLLALEDKTILMVTHKISEDELTGFDVVLVMKNGCLVHSGSPNGVMDNMQ